MGGTMKPALKKGDKAKSDNEYTIAQVINIFLKGQQELIQKIAFLESDNKHIKETLQSIKDDSSLIKKIAVSAAAMIISGALLTILKTYFNLF